MSHRLLMSQLCKLHNSYFAFLYGLCVVHEVIITRNIVDIYLLLFHLSSFWDFWFNLSLNRFPTLPLLLRLLVLSWLPRLTLLERGDLVVSIVGLFNYCWRMSNKNVSLIITSCLHRYFKVHYNQIKLVNKTDLINRLRL